MSITNFINANIYFSSFLLLFSSLLIVLKYRYRWSSDILSTAAWAAVGVISSIFAGYVSEDWISPIFGLAFYFFLVFFYRNLKEVTSIFGVFFLISLIIPSLVGIAWVFQLLHSGHKLVDISQLSLILIEMALIIYGTLILIHVIVLSCLALVRFSDLYFRFPRRNGAWEKFSNPRTDYPKVSIHLPCYSEPPSIVIETLNALASLDYPNYEVIVIDNNTPQTNLWKPLQEHCQKLGSRFNFYHIDRLEGAKAGALNKALQFTSPDADLIAIVDADYKAQPDFLIKLVGFFDEPKTGFVQTCHDYRDWENSQFLTACYYEYAMHFKLDLPAQSEWDTAYTVGTMCIIRKKALEKAGGWATWCLTEDSEIAVRLHALGYEGYYLKDTFGRGLIPETFEGYKIQRFRWTAGPIQQIKRHWRLYLPWNKNNKLTLKQKISEIFHSLSVSFSELLFFFAVLPAACIVLWFGIVRGDRWVVPNAVWVLIACAVARNILCNFIRNRLIQGNWRSYFYTAIAARSLLFTRSKACYKAWFSSDLAWKRTNKFKERHNLFRVWSSSSSEIIIGGIYLCTILFIFPYINFQKPDLVLLVALGLLNQMTSYFCAPIMALFSEKELSESQVEEEIKPLIAP